jgi:putative ABC transport system permease protein
MYNGERKDLEPQFLAALESVYPAELSGSVATGDWPYSDIITALDMIEQSDGITVLIAYLAVYIGFVLLIACAAILALQQLSEAADNASRYHLLEELGAERAMTSRALFTQIAIYFVFPLVVAICHSFVALNVVVDVVEVFGHLDIALSLAMTVGVFLVLYCAYFLLTYLGSRSMLQQKV